VIRRSALAGGLTLVLAACGSAPTGAATGTPPAGVPGTAGIGGSASPTAGASGSSSSPGPGTGAKPTVNLMLTGWKAITATGSVGECRLGKDAAGVVTKFNYQALEADVAGLGGGLYFSEGNNGFVTIKWIPSASVGFINIADVKGVSGDHKSITVDVDLGGGPGTEHVAGTIACP
jgi:hypothetical protein